MNDPVRTTGSRRILQSASVQEVLDYRLECCVVSRLYAGAGQGQQGVMDLDSIDAVDAHYRAHIGGEPQYMRFVNAPGTIGVLEWPKGSSRQRVHIYATLGLHALIHGTLAREHGFELFTGVSSGTDAFRLAFAVMANDLVSDGTFVESGHLVTAEDGCIIDGLPFKSWLMLERTDGLIPPLPLENGNHVVFLDATPVFAEEADHLKEHGLDGLFGVWEEGRPRLSDLSRTLPRALERS